MTAYSEGYARIKWTPLPAPERPRDRVARADLPCPMVVTDTMPPTEHVDGKHYDSKSAFRAVTKREGLIEVGNDPARHKRPVKQKPDRASIKETIAKARAQLGY